MTSENPFVSMTNLASVNRGDSNCPVNFWFFVSAAKTSS